MRNATRLWRRSSRALALAACAALADPASAGTLPARAWLPAAPVPPSPRPLPHALLPLGRPVAGVPAPAPAAPTPAPAPAADPGHGHAASPFVEWLRTLPGEPQDAP